MRRFFGTEDGSEDEAMRNKADVFKRVFCGKGDVQVGHVGGEAVRQPTTGMLPEVPVPRRISSVGCAEMVIFGVEGIDGDTAADN